MNKNCKTRVHVYLRSEDGDVMELEEIARTRRVANLYVDYAKENAAVMGYAYLGAVYVESKDNPPATVSMRDVNSMRFALRNRRTFGEDL